MDGILYSVRSKSHIYLPFHNGPKIPESEFTTTPRAIPPVAAYDEDEQSLCASCKDIELDGQPREYFDIWRIRLGDLCTIIQTSDFALCKAVTKAMSPVLTQAALNYAEDNENTLQIILTPTDNEAALHIGFWNFGPDGKHKNLEESIYWELQSLECFLRIDHQYLGESKLFSTTSQQPSRSAKRLQHGFCDIESMKRLLHRCIRHHGDICERKRHTLQQIPDDSLSLQQWPQDFRVVDVKDLQVVRASQKRSKQGTGVPTFS